MATYTADPYGDAAQDMGASNAAYLKFNGNTGEFTFGAQSDELPHGTKVAVDMTSFRRGWICWKDAAVVDEIMVRVVDGRPPLESELQDHGPYVKTAEQNDGWAEQAAVNFRDVETGAEYTFKASSKSALRSLGNLLKDYGRQYKQYDGFLPIAELGANSFTPANKTWGKKYAPTLKIVEWKDAGELAAAVGDDAGAYDETDDQAIAEDAGPELVAEKPAATKVAPAARPAPAAAPAAGPRRRSF
jgi:hypothetical protein